MLHFLNVRLGGRHKGQTQGSFIRVLAGEQVRLLYFLNDYKKKQIKSVEAADNKTDSWAGNIAAAFRIKAPVFKVDKPVFKLRMH